MAKKKAKGGKKEKKGGGDASENVEEKRRLDLIEVAKSLSLAVDREERDFNEFQQEREKLHYFWIVEKKNLEDKKAELRNKERELQDLDEQHQVTIKVYKQRVKHLLHEHQNEMAHLKTEGEVSLKMSQSENREGEMELKKDRQAMKMQLKEMELSHYDYLKSLKQEQDRDITKLRQEFERKTKEMHLKYEKKTKLVRDELDASRKSEIQRIEDQKNAHIQELMKSHEKVFADIKNYYNDITHNNLDLIKSLKEEVALLKAKELQEEKLMYDTAQENKRMSQPLDKALADVERLKKELETYKKDKERLQNTKSQILVLEDSLKSLKWENEVLMQRFSRVQSERDTLYSKFHSSIYEVQQKSGFKNLLLEKKLGALESGLEKTEAQLNEVITQANLDSAVVGQVTSKLEDVIEAKNQTVRDLQAELDRVVKAHQSVIRGFEGKLREYSIPKEEVGFEASLKRTA